MNGDSMVNHGVYVHRVGVANANIVLFCVQSGLVPVGHRARDLQAENENQIPSIVISTFPFLPGVCFFFFHPLTHQCSAVFALCHSSEFVFVSFEFFALQFVNGRDSLLGFCVPIFTMRISWFANCLNYGENERCTNFIAGMRSVSLQGEQMTSLY